MTISEPLRRGVYAITDEHLLPDPLFLHRVELALQEGLSALQYRNKQGPHDQRLRQCRQLRELCAHYQTPLLINDDVELCLTVGANGVHLGQSDANIEEARSRLGGDALIGVTCHANLQLARQAQKNGADYVAFGRFFPSLTKPDAPPADPRILSEAKHHLHVPIVAIGGINAENGAALIEAGADLLAVIHYLFGSDNVGSNTRRLNALFK